MLAFGVKSYLLRRPGTDIGYFCRACHEHNGHAPGHKELAGTAHLGSASKKAGYGGELDPLSASCIACHDGAAASSVEVETRRFYSEHSSGGSHPIGIDYGKQGRPPRGRGLAPASRLDRRIKLFGGRVGCGTCHDFYSATAGRLVMSNDGSRLCRECHIDK
jgi:predicted CXXCH cytochrome family protein